MEWSDSNYFVVFFNDKKMGPTPEASRIQATVSRLFRWRGNPIDIVHDA